MANFTDLNIAILLPCYNEAKSIAKVVLDFRRALPGTRIFVYDNNSQDETAEQAARAGAIVVPCFRQGKGNVVRQMFADIDADIYLMADGDGTYDATAAQTLIETLLQNNSDMVSAMTLPIFFPDIVFFHDALPKVFRRKAPGLKSRRKCLFMPLFYVCLSQR